MDGAHITHPAGPVLVHANWYRFRSGERIRHPRVQSVSFVWVVKGSGVILSCGESFTLTTNAVLRLPWGHDVDYRPDEQSPFHLGTIHLIPHHDHDVPVQMRVAFLEGDPLFNAGWLRGPAQRERPSVMSSRSTTGRNVIGLASYGVERFMAGETDEPAMRALATLIVDESAAWTEPQSTTHRHPTVLELMIDHILANLDRSLTVSGVAHAGGCSAATAERLFARHTGLSLIAWSRRRRMQEAAMLLRTSGLRVGEVARQVGYADPLYFSRVFARAYGTPPSRYAAEQLRP